jgi:hypothetical protein
MDLTVGILENKLRQFPKGTPINVCCECCHHGALGNETILGIEDKTNQTYGYIELILNNSSEPDVTVTKDEKVFYEAELKRLNELIVKKNKLITDYEDQMNCFSKNCEYLMKHKESEH